MPIGPSWPGERENPHYEKKAGTLGFLDIKLPDDLTANAIYDTLMENTKADVAELKSSPLEGAANYDLKFCLPREVRSIVFK